MQIYIQVETVGGSEAQVYNGANVSDAQAFMAGLTGDFSHVQVSMSCTTTEGEGRMLQRGAVDELCEPLLADIDDWLAANAAYA